MTTSNSIAGETFSQWRVIGAAFVRKQGKRAWECVCSCGVTRVVLERHLKSGASASCGHPRSGRGRSHPNSGFSRTATYSSWRAMMRRCYYPKNANYHRYGARGVAVCAQWHQFQNFLADMGERPSGTSLDRIDNRRGYEPGNCRWATQAMQNANRRYSTKAA